MPPTSTFPGHQLTCLLIIHVLVRMNANVPSSATKNTNAASRPEWTISRWNSLPTVAMRGDITGKLSAPAVAF